MYFLVSVDVSVCFYVFGCMYACVWLVSDVCVCSTEYVSVCGLCLLRVCVCVCVCMCVCLSVCAPEDLCRSNISISFRVLIH